MAIPRYTSIVFIHKSTNIVCATFESKFHETDCARSLKEVIVSRSRQFSVYLQGSAIE